MAQIPWAENFKISHPFFRKDLMSRTHESEFQHLKLLPCLVKIHSIVEIQSFITSFFPNWAEIQIASKNKFVHIPYNPMPIFCTWTKINILGGK